METEPTSNVAISTESPIYENYEYDVVISTKSSNSEDYAAVNSNIASYIYVYGTPAIWVIGTIGNILSFAVFSRKAMRGSLTAFLFRCLAVFDLLTIQQFWENIFYLFGVVVVPPNNWYCRILYLICVSSQYIAAWVLVGISVERFIGVTWPHKAKILCTIRKGQIYIFVLVIFFYTLMSPGIFTLVSFSSYEPALGYIINYCEITCQYDIYVHFQPIVELVTYAIIPFLLMFTFNIFIIIGLVKSHCHRQVMNIGNTSDAGIIGMTLMLISVSVAFILFTTPNTVSFTLLLVDIRLSELWSVGAVTLCLNHSINIFLYCATGQKFRREFKAMMCCSK